MPIDLVISWVLCNDYGQSPYTNDPLSDFNVLSAVSSDGCTTIAL